MNKPETFQCALDSILVEVNLLPANIPQEDLVKDLQDTIRYIHAEMVKGPREELWYSTFRAGMLGVQAITGKSATQILQDVHGMVVSKQRDYGVGNILAFGLFGVLVRLNDKVERLKNLLRTGHAPANESILDTWMDVMGYSTLGIMLTRDWFTLPLAETAEEVGANA